ncbi:MAG TPA: dihydrolipoamide acetyltransferase family protein [Bacteroidales bacterium]|nr:dihydrolipoamide acetyltransferase family protein [Bacteroidales bacterium]
MATQVIMPKQGQSVETCIITGWYRKKGETVKTGDLLFSYETDKAAFDFESPADGILLEIIHPEGSEVPVLDIVALIGQEGEETSSPNIPDVSAIPAEENQTPSKEFREISATAAPVTGQIDTEALPKLRISPRAKRLAERKGIDYASLTGSGPNGRIICSDVMGAIAGTSLATEPSLKTGAEYTDQPVTNIRKLIARAMHDSLLNSAQLTHHMSADVRKILEARRKIKEGMSTGKNTQDITINDMICWCVIRALKKHPEINSHFLDDRIRRFDTVNLGIAVDTQRGLMVPATKSAGDMDIRSLSAALKKAADDCRRGNINPELIQSTAATFTVSNLGSYGVEMFTPVINLPQVAILGVCTIINRPADLGNNTFGFVPYIGLSLTYDHRAVDGGPATLFLGEIKKEIENLTL